MSSVANTCLKDVNHKNLVISHCEFVVSSTLLITAQFFCAQISWHTLCPSPMETFQYSTIKGRNKCIDMLSGCFRNLFYLYDPLLSSNSLCLLKCIIRLWFYTNEVNNDFNLLLCQICNSNYPSNYCTNK